ncbi:MAG: dephospho-CoA kinase [Pseudomonadales bacterium]
MQVLIVGLTGGIGSGKSAAAERFSELGVCVVNADAVAREVVAPGTPALDAIAERFGLQVLQGDGSLDRSALRHTVFSDPAEREWLEQLTHPLVGELTAARLGAPRDTQEPPYRILESPLLLETGRQQFVHRVLVVDCPRELQVARVMRRDASSRQQVLRMIDAQMSRDAKLALADDVIDNSGSLEALQDTVDQLHRKYCVLADVQESLEEP